MQKSKGLKKVVIGLNGLNEKERSMKEKEIKMRRMNSLNEPYDIKTLISTQVTKNVNIFSSFLIFNFLFFVFFLFESNKRNEPCTIEFKHNAC